MFGWRGKSGEPEATVSRSMEELRLKQEANAAAWGLGSTERWDADLDRGTIRFGRSDGSAIIAPLQIVGTYNSDDGTWLWGWDHPSVAEPLSQAAKLARAFGQKHRLQQYLERKVQCSMDEAWQFTAVAAHLSRATGSYRGPTGATYVFMTFGPVTHLEPIDPATINSARAAEEAWREGQLTKALLLPLELGGREVSENIAYLLPNKSVAMSTLALELIEAVRSGMIEFSINPHYRGSSFVLSGLSVTAARSGEAPGFKREIIFW